MIDRSRITLCTKSTIAEAWATVTGHAAVVDADAETNVAVALRSGRRAFADVQTNLRVKRTGDNGPVEPYWSDEVTWDEGKKIGRIGKGFLSVHYVRRTDTQPAYRTYGESIGADIAVWLDIFAAEMGEDAVARAGFGYVNRFSFPSEGFDLSKHFKVSLGIAGAPDGAVALGLGVQLRFREPDRSIDVFVEVMVDASASEDDTISVTTKVFAERPLDDAKQKDTEALKKAIFECKGSAKAAFFHLATDATLLAMDAKES